LIFNWFFVCSPLILPDNIELCEASFFCNNHGVYNSNSKFVYFLFYLFIFILKKKKNTTQLVVVNVFSVLLVKNVKYVKVINLHYLKIVQQ